jgi:DsbC/DsbD-like thiol-disulfide interchange protein
MTSSIARFAAFLGLTAACASGAVAGPWHETEGARIRLLVADAPAGETLRGVLEIDLEPGWKTYWRDPVDSGVPPSLGVRGMRTELHFPAPKWLSDDYASYAGYDAPVSLPVTLTPLSSGGSGEIEAEIFLGVCETICIPVKTTLAADPSAADVAAIDASFGLLPEPASPEFGVSLVASGQDHFTVEVALPEGLDDPQLFIASTPYHAIGAPRRVVEDGKPVRFEVPVEGLAARIVDAPASYTLVAGGRSVSGEIGISY